MDSLLFPILIAFSVALGGWAAARLALERTQRGRRKLAQRLSMEGRGTDVGGLDPIGSIVREVPVVGVPPWLAKQPLVKLLHRRLVQALPQTTLPRFVGIAGGLGVATYMVTFVIGDSLLVSAACGAAAAYLPFFWLRHKRSARQSP